MKRRNPSWGCPRIAQQIALAFAVDIDKDVVRRVLATHYRPAPHSGGPSWLTFLGHAKDSRPESPGQPPRSDRGHQRRARGSLTVWLGLTDGKLANWNSPRPTRRKPGRQRKYSNHAIETTVTLGLVFGLASRQTEGFLRSLLTLLNLDNDVPDHSTISRRKARLGKVASYERRTVKPVHLRIDSSGLSVHVGQLRTPPKARDYRKLHLAVDEQTSDVVACDLTSKRARDASRVASLVGQIERPIASAKADAAYDTGDVYKTLENHRAHRSPKVLIPPRKGAQLALDSAGTRQRNRNIRARSRVGKRKWYVASGYSRRSKVETTFHRYKAILGSAMRARGLASQRVEVRLGCKILNTMTALGIPDGEMIG